MVEQEPVLLKENEIIRLTHKIFRSTYGPETYTFSFQTKKELHVISTLYPESLISLNRNQQSRVNRDVPSASMEVLEMLHRLTFYI